MFFGSLSIRHVLIRLADSVINEIWKFLTFLKKICENSEIFTPQFFLWIFFLKCFIDWNFFTWEQLADLKMCLGLKTLSITFISVHRIITKWNLGDKKSEARDKTIFPAISRIKL